MSKSVTGFGVVRAGGTVIISHRSRFDAAVDESFGDGERVAVTVEKSTRTLRQNRTYRWWCNIIADHFGCDPDYIHEENKRLFNAKITPIADPVTGVVTEVSYPGSTATLKVDEFQGFQERVQRGWAEQGVDLPWPNEDQFLPASPSNFESRGDNGNAGPAPKQQGGEQLPEED